MTNAGKIGYINLHPASRLIIFLSIIQAVSVSGGLLPYLFFTVSFIIIASLSGVHVTELIKKLKPFIVILLSTFFINLFFGSGLETSAELTFRFLLIILFSVLLTVTTDAKSLVAVMMYPFGKRADNLKTVLMVAMEFIPIFIEEIKLIISVIKAEHSKPYKAVFKPELYLKPLIEGIFTRSGEVAYGVREGRFETSPLPKIKAIEVAVTLLSIAAVVVYAI